MKHLREVSEGTIQAKGRLPQDGSLWHKDDFDFKVIKTQQMQEKLSTSVPTACNYTGKEPVPGGKLLTDIPLSMLRL